MRRIVLEDPFARSAIWSRNLAVFALIVALIGVFLSRKGLDPQAALAIIGAALALAALAVLSAMLSMAVIWHTGFRGVGLSFLAVLIAALLFAYPAYVAVQARTQTDLSDVSTDLDDPPSFITTPAVLVARKGVTLPVRQDEADRTLQRQLYPDLQSLSFEADVDDVERAIRTLIKRRHWTIIGSVKPENFQTGHIDAVASSAIMGFPADVTFRIRELGNRTEVDIRSVSRKGWGEQPGANVSRVEKMIDDLTEAVGGEG